MGGVGLGGGGGTGWGNAATMRPSRCSLEGLCRGVGFEGGLLAVLSDSNLGTDLGGTMSPTGLRRGVGFAGGLLDEGLLSDADQCISLGSGGGSGMGPGGGPGGGWG